jgi:hypothetical protein
MPALSQSLIFHVVTGTNTVLVDYPNTGTSTLSYFSDKVKGDGYFGGSDGFHTISVNSSRYFVGTVTMQATLAAEPIDSDWFDIADTAVSYRQNEIRTTNTVDLFNFTGNFVWVRGHILIDEGAVLSIQYNH